MTDTIRISWDNDQKTILRYTFIRQLKWEDYYQALRKGREMMATVDHDVCILNDMSKLEYFPPNFISTARSVINDRPANTGLAIFLTTSSFFKALHTVLSKVIPNVPTDYILVTTEEEAYKRLNTWIEENVDLSSNGHSANNGN